MEHSIRVRNRLLAALPLADFHLLAPHLRKVALEPDAVLVRSGDRIAQIYFPLSGVIAFIMEMPNGQTVATAVIGNEGAAGIISALGTSRSPMTAVVRVAGTALQIAPARFHAALSRSGALGDAVQTLTRALLAQFQHVAACNALHSVEARTARWLLRSNRRGMIEIDRPRLEASACECYKVMRRRINRIVPPDAMKSRIQVAPAHPQFQRATGERPRSH
jgi:CRP-like cAMP-binding protein